jgi:two-component system cell cycle sensor histidine kinase/response regulator CckA
MSEDDPISDPRLDSRFLDSIVEHLPVMLFVKDATHLRFARVNRALERLLGIHRDELLGRSDFDLFPWDEAAAFTEKDHEVLASGALHDIPEEPIHAADGSIRWLHTRKIPVLDATGRPEFLLGISEDITEAKLAKEALEAAERKLRNRDAWLRVLLHTFPGVVWAADGDLRFTAVAGAHLDRLHLDPDEVVGSLVVEQLGQRLVLASGEDRTVSGNFTSLAEMQDEAMAGTAVVGEFTDGERDYELRLEPMVPEQRVGVVATALDITERRKLEQERIESRMQEAQKLESLGLLAGGIAHDFNNLLVGMLGNASLALGELDEEGTRDLPEVARLRQHLERIEAAAERAADLTRQMLAYSGRGRFVVEPIDLSEVVRDMTALLDVSVSKDITIDLQLGEDLAAIEADVVQLRQVVMNLITNAANAMEEGRGTIGVSTRAFVADEWFVAGTRMAAGELSTGGYVVLEVRDTGRGMEPAVVERMFDPFFTTRAEGHGLGLAAVLGIIRGHGGAIRVISAPRRGTTVQAYFPAGTQATSQSVPTLMEYDEGPTGRVLVVDDEPAVRQLARVALERAGFSVSVAENGAEALDVFFENPEDYGVILLDLTMPVMDGDETFRALRRLRPGVRVLLSSGFNEQEATARFAGRGLAGFLQKPYRARQLVAKVRDLFESRGPGD